MGRDEIAGPRPFGYARLNAARVPGWALAVQGLWAALLVLPRTFNGKEYGNLYGDLLDYVISAALLFYILTIVGIFRLRRTRPDAHRPYRAFGYPIVPALYIAGAATIMLALFFYRWRTTWPGMAIVALGIPIYFVVRAMQLDFRKPAALDDMFSVETRPIELGGASLTLDQRVLRGDETLVTAIVKVVCVEAGRARRLPPPPPRRARGPRRTQRVDAPLSADSLPWAFP